MVSEPQDETEKNDTRAPDKGPWHKFHCLVCYVRQLKNTELNEQITAAIIRSTWIDATAASDGLTGGNDQSNLTTVFHNMCSITRMSGRLI